ncbi:MAG: CopD family protein [Flavobacteriaceae bacterium]|jgi:putative membrane protein|nr:CopD family protein [Flavobacteriaceae bacterium]MBT7458738.1 CopD family protein [Flavobacteriaceae bacterium]MCH1384709.1 CopD family protein [Flavobacteriaceae bacterium]MDG0967110.1 CopD family protein [Flavobacteriaceae bacterium]
MEYNYIKAFHLIFVITWFAGLFYIPRLFIYHIEASQKERSSAAILVPQLKLMSRRLWTIICWPSAVLATGFAVWLLLLNPGLLFMQWMLIKLGFVGLLIIYHLITHQMYLALQRDKIHYTSNFMRVWNEGATLLLFAIIFLAILKTSFDWIYGLIGLVGLGVVLMLGIRLYKRVRNKN